MRLLKVTVMSTKKSTPRGLPHVLSKFSPN
jgi:hypothetical protein